MSLIREPNDEGEVSLEELPPLQSDQLRLQIAKYKDRTKSILEDISVGSISMQLVVDPLVADPEIMNSALQVLKYLDDHREDEPDLVKGKTVVDMGTGSGIIGLAAAQLGASRVMMPDISADAVKNAAKNIKSQKLDDRCTAFQSDLFSNFQDDDPADVQIFNHPFFAAKPVEGEDWTCMMLGGTELLRRYFREAPKYSKPEAIYILPWYTKANLENQPDNDPGKIAEEMGYQIVDTEVQEPVKQGVQQGYDFIIYKLKYAGDAEGADGK